PNGTVAPGQVLPYALLPLFWDVSRRVPMNGSTASNAAMSRWPRSAAAPAAGVSPATSAPRTRAVVRSLRRPGGGGSAAVHMTAVFLPSLMLTTLSVGDPPRGRGPIFERLGLAGGRPGRRPDEFRATPGGVRRRGRGPECGPPAGQSGGAPARGRSGSGHLVHERGAGPAEFADLRRDLCGCQDLV